MKPNQRKKAEPNNINVNHIDNCLNNECYNDLYYFEKLNVSIFSYDSSGIAVRTLERGKDNQLHFQENRLTRQIEQKIKQQYYFATKTQFTFDEESEEIIIIQQDCKSLKICTFKLQQNEFQMEMRDYNFKDKEVHTIQAFEKYYIGYRYNLKQVYIFRKNNMKLVLRQILKSLHYQSQTQSFHLLLIRSRMEVLFYKRSSFKLKIIRKLKTVHYQLFIMKHKQNLYQGRYFAIQENLQLRIIDSTNMKQKQQNDLSKNESYVWNIYQLGFFFIIKESKLRNRNSIQLQKDTLVQTLKVNAELNSIKYSKSLGLLVFL